MLNKAQIEYLKEEFQFLTECADEYEKNGMHTKCEIARREAHQTYKILDILLEIEGREIEEIL